MVVQAIKDIEVYPQNARNLYEKVIDKKLLDIPIRKGAWTCRQVFHHLADSHLNSYMRIKLALTEENPTVKPYKEELWAELDDVSTVSPQVSLEILKGIHQRLVAILVNLEDKQLARTFHHPEAGDLTVRKYIESIANHGKIHLLSVQKLLDQL